MDKSLVKDCGKNGGMSIRPRGFALVITLSLLVLLTVVAVGLLSLSAVSVRVASRDDARAVARSNARLALTIALGEVGPFLLYARVKLDPLLDRGGGVDR